MLKRFFSRFQADAASEPFAVWVKAAFLILIVFRLWLSAGQTMTAYGDSGHDDRLFLTLAQNILKTGWLGGFNHVTLIKGPFYPIWIAAAFFIGIPLFFSQQVLYLFACVIFALAVRPFVKRPVVVLIIFVVLAFNPMSYCGQGMDRPFREGIYPALTMLSLGGATGLLARCGQGLKRLLLWAALFGLSLSAFYLTREEGVWIIPSVLLMVSMAAVSVLVARPDGRVRAFLICLLPFFILIASIGAVSEINRRHYGVFTAVEMKSQYFRAAYGALTRVKHGKWNPYIPVPKDVRERIYEVSPAFAELRPSIEGEIGRAWIANPCRYLSVCDDIGGGWFVWAFREAVAAAGHYRSAVDAAEYYRHLASEINGACDDGRLECGPRRASLAPPWDNRYLRPMLGAFKNGIVSLVRFDGFSAASLPSTGAEDLMDIFRDMTGERLTSDRLFGQRLVGWAFSPDSAIEVSVHDKDGNMISDGVEMLDSPDVYDYFLRDGKDFTNARKARFSITARCAGGCYLYMKKGGSIIERTRFEDLRTRWTPDLYFTVDRVDNGFPTQTKLRRVKERILTGIASVYLKAVPVLSILALIAYLAQTALNIKDREVTGIYVVSTAIVMAVVIRMLLLALIDVSSFPVMYIVYLSPAYPLLLMAMTLVFVDCRRFMPRSLRE